MGEARDGVSVFKRTAYRGFIYKSEFGFPWTHFTSQLLTNNSWSSYRIFDSFPFSPFPSACTILMDLVTGKERFHGRNRICGRISIYKSWFLRQFTSQSYLCTTRNILPQKFHHPPLHIRLFCFLIPSRYLLFALSTKVALLELNSVLAVWSLLETSRLISFHSLASVFLFFGLRHLSSVLMIQTNTLHDKATCMMPDGKLLVTLSGDNDRGQIDGLRMVKGSLKEKWEEGSYAVSKG